LGPLLTLLLLAAPAFGAARGEIRVVGEIPCAGYLAPAGADSGLLLVGSGSGVRLHAPAGRASFTLSVRTNCRYNHSRPLIVNKLD